MGWMYENGLCVEQNKETAILWYEKAAKQGHKSAAIFLHELKLEK
jgi:TPR repeat protein